MQPPRERVPAWERRQPAWERSLRGPQQLQAPQKVLLQQQVEAQAPPV